MIEEIVVKNVTVYDKYRPNKFLKSILYVTL